MTSVVEIKGRNFIGKTNGTLIRKFIMDEYHAGLISGHEYDTQCAKRIMASGILGDCKLSEWHIAFNRQKLNIICINPNTGVYKKKYARVKESGIAANGTMTYDRKVVLGHLATITEELRKLTMQL